MAIKEVTHTAVAICFDAGELAELGLNSRLNGKTARALVNKALRARGVKPWAETEIEIFSFNGTLLLLARPAKYENYLFRFRNAESMLAAASLCPIEMPGRLTYFDESFILSVLSTAERLPFPLFEFGELLPVSKDLMAHFEEHGEIVVSEQAIAVLRQFFA